MEFLRKRKKVWRIRAEGKKMAVSEKYRLALMGFVMAFKAF